MSIYTRKILRDLIFKTTGRPQKIVRRRERKLKKKKNGRPKNENGLNDGCILVRKTEQFTGCKVPGYFVLDGGDIRW